MINYFAKFNPTLLSLFEKIRKAPKPTEASDACKGEPINYFATKNPALTEIMNQVEDEQVEPSVTN